MNIKKNVYQNYKVLLDKSFIKDDILLVSIREKDIEKIRSWRNSQLNILRQNKKITKYEQKYYFKNKIFSEFFCSQPRNILFSILRKNKLIGYGGLVHIDWPNKKAEISFLLDNKISGKKEDYTFLFPTFLSIINNISFKILKLEKLTAELYDIRNYYIEPLKKNNFKIEGRLKKHIIINGKRVDSLLFGYTKKGT